MFYLSKTLLFDLLEDTVSSLFRYVFRGTCFYNFQPCFFRFLSENVPKLVPQWGGQNLPKSIENQLLPAGVPLGSSGEPKATKMEPKGAKMTPGHPKMTSNMWFWDAK